MAEKAPTLQRPPNRDMYQPDTAPGGKGATTCASNVIPGETIVDVRWRIADSHDDGDGSSTGTCGASADTD